jgi:hypothetical protein
MAKRHRPPPGEPGDHDQIWTAVISGSFLILAEILQYLLTGWSLGR